MTTGQNLPAPSRHGRNFCMCGCVVSQCRCYDCGGGDRIVTRRCDECRVCPPLTCTKRLGHKGDHLHDPAGDTVGSCAHIISRGPP